MSSKIRGVLFLLVFYSLSTFLSGCQSSVSKVPSWVRERVFEYSEVKWAYENGYFYEDPVVIEQDGVKLTVWAILADLALTQIVYSIEDDNERYLFAFITAVDGEPIVGPAQFINSNSIKNDAPITAAEGKSIVGPARPSIKTPYGTTGVLAVDSLPEGQHEITIAVTYNQSIVFETKVRADRIHMSHINSKHQLDKIIETKNGSIIINYVVYTPTKIYANITSKDAFLLYDTDLPNSSVYLTDEKINIPAPIMGGSTLEYPYNLEIDRPRKADDVKLVIPAVYYRDDIELILTPDDIGVQKSFAGTVFTLQDWRKEADGLKLDILFSSIGGLYRIIGWEVPNVPSSGRTDRSFDNRTYPNDDHLITYELPSEWADVSEVVAVKAEMIAEGPWILPLPKPDS